MAHVGFSFGELVPFTLLNLGLDIRSLQAFGNLEGTIYETRFLNLGLSCISTLLFEEPQLHDLALLAYLLFGLALASSTLFAYTIRQEKFMLSCSMAD